MSIYFDADHRIFHLDAGDSSYLIQLYRDYPSHLYWGRRLQHEDHSYMQKMTPRASQSAIPFPESPEFSLDTLCQEYPMNGTTDMRRPAIEIVNHDGSYAADLKYVGHKIYKGKKKLAGLPSTYVESESEAETLEIELADDVSNLHVFLSYSAFAEFNAVARSARIMNGGCDAVNIKSAMSACVDFDNIRYEILLNYGAWQRERYLERRKLPHGTVLIDSRRGVSSHMHNPFFVLSQYEANEKYGDVYGFSLVYSGNFTAGVETGMFDTARAFIGINPDGFDWLLEPESSFQTPEAVLVFSGRGFGGMSRTYHKLYRTRLCRGKFRDLPRPVVENTWESCCFHFDENKILELAKQSSALGIKMLVIDDGWFGHRDNDYSSLGDWVVNREKLPSGLEGIADQIKKYGMELGLWFEPEMVNPESDLYRSHPEWCLHIPARKMSKARNQYMLDLTREDVQNYIYNSMETILKSGCIKYVKWDMNRNMSETGSAALPPERQGEVAHRYVLGLYKILDKLVNRFPEILFESCSAGGGRFDPGMLYYMPQTWTSDNTDPIERLKIQYGTSLVYPPSCISAHVSSPGNRINRVEELKLRTLVAFTGAFGYELDVTQLNENERKQIRDGVQLYSTVGDMIQKSDLFRLRNPFDGSDAAWMYVSADRREALVFYFSITGKTNGMLDRLQLDGLDESKHYEDLQTGMRYSGPQLMGYGLNIYASGERGYQFWHLMEK